MNLKHGLACQWIPWSSESELKSLRVTKFFFSSLLLKCLRSYGTGEWKGDNTENSPEKEFVKCHTKFEIFLSERWKMEPPTQWNDWPKFHTCGISLETGA